MAEREEMLRELACLEGESWPAGAQQVQDMLRQIDAGFYGICIDCGNQISPARLEAKPDAQRCIVCQIQYENRLGKR